MIHVLTHLDRWAACEDVPLSRGRWANPSHGPLQGLPLYAPWTSARPGLVRRWGGSRVAGLDYGLRLPAGPSPSRRGGVGLTSVGESPLFPWDPPVAACGLPPSPLPQGRMTRLTLLLEGRCNDTPVISQLC